MKYRNSSKHLFDEMWIPGSLTTHTYVGIFRHMYNVQCTCIKNPVHEEHALHCTDHFGALQSTSPPGLLSEADSHMVTPLAFVREGS